MSTTPPIQYSGPVISPDVPFETRRHLQLLYQKLANHTQAFSLQQAQINAVKSGVSTQTIIEGGSGGGAPSTATGIAVNNQSGSTSYATMNGDNNSLVVVSDASPIVVTLESQAPPWACFIANQGALGAGTATLTPAAGTISYAGNPGAASMPLLPTYCALVAFDGSNWWAWTEPIVPVSFGSVTHQWLNSYNAATGAFTATQPAFTDISGTVAPTQLPAPTTATLGGVKAVAPVPHEWVDSIDNTGTPQLSQPDFTDLTGTATAAQLPAGVPIVSFGTGAPSGSSTEGYLYFDTSVSPFNGYVYHSGAWNAFN